MSEIYTPKISRRATLRWLFAASIASSAYRSAYGRRVRSRANTGQNGHGNSPDMMNPTVPWERTMSSDQLRCTAALGDLILPESPDGPAPSALGIPEFIDEWVSAPYPLQQADRGQIFSGLSWFDEEAGRRGRQFADLHIDQRQELFNEVAPQLSTVSQTPAVACLRRLRFLVVGAYCSTREGLNYIGYSGNMALPSYPAPTDAEKSIVAQELKKLGLL